MRKPVYMPGELREYDSAEHSYRTGVNTGEKTLVQQHFVDEVDINTIVRRFGLTRGMPSGLAGGVYGDFTGISDYEDAEARISRARSGFMRLPPDVRERFGNDPAELIRMAQELPEDEFTTLVTPTAVPSVPAVEPVS